MRFLIEGNPIPAARPRVTKNGTYNPKKKELEALSWEIEEQILKNNYRYLPSSGPISMSITFFMPIPKGNSKKRRNEIKGKPHTKRCDLDNLVKFLCDSMNGIIFKDDSQVYCIDATKLWSENPRTQISIINVDRIGYE